MLSLKDFKEYEVLSKEKISGGDVWGYSYACNDTTRGGFSTIGPNMNLAEVLERCGTAGFVATPIYE